jgi:hypothetical protein
MVDNALVYLGPPPRSVPRGLRWALLANLSTMWGVVLLGLGALVTLGVMLGGDPVADYRLDRDALETSGVLTAVERVLSGKRDSVYRYDYEFETSGGARGTGASYASQYRKPPQPVVVEVSRTDSRISRARDTRLTVYPQGLQIAATAVLGLLVILGGGLIFGGLRRGTREIRLLRSGELARATVTGCRIATDRAGRALPLDQFRARWQGELARVAAQSTARPVRLLIGCFLAPFVLVWFAGIAGLLFGLGMALFVEGSSTINDRVASRWETIPLLLLVLVVWVAAGVGTFLFVRRMIAARTRRKSSGW